MEPENQIDARPTGGNDAVAKNYRMGATIAFFVVVSFILGVLFGELRDKPVSATSGNSMRARIGQVLNRQVDPSAMLDKDVDFAQFWEVWKMVKEKHVDQAATSDVKMFYGAVAGMVGSLGDPYSVYFDPELAQKFAKDLEGSFEGIGAEIGIKADQLTVIAPLPGTPAEKAGLKAGDRIYAIDGVETIGMPVEEAVSHIRGEKGTTVKLLIARDGIKEAKEIVIKRATIIVQAVEWKTIKTKDGKKLAYIKISHFNEQVDSKFNAAIRAILAEDPAGLILDLRNNPGGFLDTAVTVSGEWVHEDTVVIEKFNDGNEKKYASQGLARLSDLPTVVLINGGSASASEIVAGALHDHDKATLVGEKSFGKGSVQDYVEFGDHSALKLTVALWLTPDGLSINKAGIEPDVAVKMSTEDFNADKDPQMDKAIELLLSPDGLPKKTAPAAEVPAKK